MFRGVRGHPAPLAIAYEGVLGTVLMFRGKRQWKSALNPLIVHSLKTLSSAPCAPLGLSWGRCARRPLCTPSFLFQGQPWLRTTRRANWRPSPTASKWPPNSRPRCRRVNPRALVLPWLQTNCLWPGLKGLLRRPPNPSPCWLPVSARRLAPRKRRPWFRMVVASRRLSRAMAGCWPKRSRTALVPQNQSATQRGRRFLS